MRILVVALGSAGDVVPFVDIGGELRRRGYDVFLLANPHFAVAAENAGLSMVPIGTAESYQEMMRDPALFQWRTSRASLLATYFGEAVELANRAIEQWNESGQTVLLAPAQTSAMWPAAEALNIPLVGGLVSPTWLYSPHDPPYPSRPLPFFLSQLARSRAGLRLFHRARRAVGRTIALFRPTKAVVVQPDPFVSLLNRLRAGMGLPEITSGFAGTPQILAKRILCLWPDWFAAKQMDWPRQAEATGFPCLQIALPRSAGDEEAVKPLLFTTGSVASDQQSFYEQAALACQILKLPGILVTPHSHEVPALLPAGVTHVPHVIFREIFPQCALVVHHGGIGTIALALAAGVPQIARPLMGEQFDLSCRMQRLGVGAMLPHPDVGANQLAGLIAKLLSSKRVAERCRHWSDKMAAASGVAQAANVVEIVANE